MLCKQLPEALEMGEAHLIRIEHSLSNTMLIAMSSPQSGGQDPSSVSL